MAVRWFAQRLQDPTLRNLSAPALFDHALEFSPQGGQLLDALFDVLEMTNGNPRHGLARRVGLVSELQEIADLGLREAELTAVANEGQAR
jgi:hypothetical protein